MRTSLRLMPAALALLAAHSLTFADPVTGAQIRCANPDQYFALHQERRGEATQLSAQIQFNVGHPATGQALFVNGHNQATCRITILDGKKILGNPQWSLGANGEDPKGALSTLSVKARKSTNAEGNPEAIFEVNGTRRSVVNLLLIVNVQ